ncbi:MAG TPA: hypothetical protein ENN05_09305 [Deltaproteobacteria bacterium]|nr:hypothetical protein [Deltaproteobacteria bacterium]
MQEKTRDFALSALFIDLGAGDVRKTMLDPDLSCSFLGGRGIAARLLAQQPCVDPLEENAALIFSTGPLTGSRIPAGGRMMISGFSPLTGTVCSCSVGGRLAIMMKRAGIDLISITGKAKARTVIEIDNQDVRLIRSAIPANAPLSSIFEGYRSFNGSVAAAGQAAFLGCRYASIMIDGSFASGRGGLGCAMAAKNLQAVAIRGSGKISVYDREQEDLARTDILRLFDASPAIMGRSGISRYGTAALVDLMASRRMMPTANFRRTFFEEYRAFSATRIREKENPKHHACHGCPIACKKRSASDIPEFETLSHFGALNENADLASIIEANSICNEIGVDTITAAATIACLAEIRQQRYTRICPDRQGQRDHICTRRRGAAQNGLCSACPGTGGTGKVHVRQVAGNACIRSARGIRNGPGLLHLHQRGMPSAGIPYRPRDPAQACFNRPLLVFGQGPHHKNCRRPQRRHRLHRGMQVRLFRCISRGICKGACRSDRT